MHPLLQAITDIADQAVVLPAALVAATALLILGWRRGAFGWAVSAAATLASILLLKLVALICHLPVESPSGHTASAALFAGGLCWLFGGGRAQALALALVAASAIGATRLALGVHSVPDVLIGGALGLVGAAVAIRLTGKPPAPFRRRRLALALLASLFTTYGRHLGAESVIRTIGSAASCHFP